MAEELQCDFRLPDILSKWCPLFGAGKFNILIKDVCGSCVNEPLIVQGTKEKQKHFIGLLLKDGQLVLILRGRKKEEHTIPLVVNDGQWHYLSMTSVKKNLIIRVGISGVKNYGEKSAVTRLQLPKRLNAANIMFIGGISETAGGSLPGELFARLEQFKGCIRKFQINNSTQDLARPGRHFNVGQCFPTVEKGSYFPGDAYVIYSN